MKTPPFNRRRVGTVLPVWAAWLALLMWAAVQLAQWVAK